MSVLIRGMEMPESCSVCPCNYDNVCAVDYKYPTFNEWRSKRPDWCPLVELPAQHGRLIDADALAKDVQTLQKYRFSLEDPDIFVNRRLVMWFIRDNQTIIEAEGKE